MARLQTSQSIKVDGGINRSAFILPLNWRSNFQRLDGLLVTYFWYTLYSSIMTVRRTAAAECQAS